MNGDTVISRFTTSADPDRAHADSEEIILTINQPENSITMAARSSSGRAMDTFTLPAGTAM